MLGHVPTQSCIHVHVDNTVTHTENSKSSAQLLLRFVHKDTYYEIHVKFILLYIQHI